MLKAMMFIDGTWFDVALREKYSRNGKRPYIENLPFGRIVAGVRHHLKTHLGFEVDLVRVNWVAGHPNPTTVLQTRDDIEAAERIEEGWRSFRAFPASSVELYPYDFKGKALVKRNGQDSPLPTDHKDIPIVREKCVDVAVATKLLYYAAIPGAYDVAVLLSGDQDYVPVLRAARALGKRVLVASFPGCPSASSVLCGPKEGAGDFWDVEPFNIATCIEPAELFPASRDQRRLGRQRGAGGDRAFGEGSETHGSADPKRLG